MAEPNSLTGFQIEVAHLFLGIEASKGYLVAGGAALLAADLIARPTEDLDLFASAPVASVIEAKDEFVRALRARSYEVSVLQDSATFCRMIVAREGDEVLVDLAIDSPPSRTPTMTLLGPSLAPEELAGRKQLALFGRAEARDFADVFVLARQFGEDALLQQAAALDAGFDTDVLAQMMQPSDDSTTTRSRYHRQTCLRPRSSSVRGRMSWADLGVPEHTDRVCSPVHAAADDRAKDLVGESHAGVAVLEGVTLAPLQILAAEGRALWLKSRGTADSLSSVRWLAARRGTTPTSIYWSRRRRGRRRSGSFGSRS